MSTLKLDKPEIHCKVWGRELWIANNPDYCGKILEFNNGANFSMHFHAIKKETWYVLEGEFLLEYYDYQTAVRKHTALFPGDVVHVEPNTLHKLSAVTEGRILEVSTQHFENDSYRIEPSHGN